jgi:hypothetical protein
MKKRNKDTLQPGWPVAPGCSPADPFGSYTGVPEDPEDAPVQDADDL